MSAELIAEVLAQHRVGVHRPDRADGERVYYVFCRCGLPGSPGPFTQWSTANEAAERHQAERVAEALAHGAPAEAGEVQR